MLYSEFTTITGLEISRDDYDNVIEPMYMALDIDKHEFCKMIKPTARIMAKHLADERKRAEMLEQPLVFINQQGKTPNGCYYIGYYAKLVGAAIRSGKAIIRNLTEDEFMLESRYHTMYWREDEKITAPGIGHRTYDEQDVILITRY